MSVFSQCLRINCVHLEKIDCALLGKLKATFKSRYNPAVVLCHIIEIEIFRFLNLRFLNQRVRLFFQSAKSIRVTLYVYVGMKFDLKLHA